MGRRVVKPRFDPEKLDRPATYKPDKDVPFLTMRELRQFRPWYEVEPINVAALRKRLRVSQAVFAARYGIPLATLRDWEQGRRTPDMTAQAYLRVIAREPEAVRRALEAA
jgi:DNA-binding transcriptional regulator YiaG